MTYNVFGGTLNLTQSVYPPVIGVRLFIGLRKKIIKASVKSRNLRKIAERMDIG